ncbi:MAG TPA: PrgI family protein [bacterium]|nr:PrgI family protein [bacterium]
MLQYKVPQNIKMPDQIIGSLTLEQFLYLLFAAGLIYVAYLYIGYGNLFYVISIAISLIAIAFAFVPVNEQPFSKFVANFILFLARPKVLLWLQLPPPIFDTGLSEKKKDDKAEKEAIRHPEEVKSQLQQLSLVLDTQMSPASIRAKIESLDTDKPIGIVPAKKVLPSHQDNNPSTPPNKTNIASRFSQVSSTITSLFKRPPKSTGNVTDNMKQAQEKKKQQMMEIANSIRRP